MAWGRGCGLGLAAQEIGGDSTQVAAESQFSETTRTAEELILVCAAR
jgi:hypothetical protein